MTLKNADNKRVYRRSVSAWSIWLGTGTGELMVCEARWRTNSVFVCWGNQEMTRLSFPIWRIRHGRCS